VNLSTQRPRPPPAAQTRSRPSKIPLLATLATLAALNVSRAAEPPVTIENVRVGPGTQVSGGRYKVGAWTPVRIDLQSGPERFRGLVQVIAPDEEGNPTTFTRPIDLGARQMVRNIAAYCRPGTQSAEITVRVVDERGRPQARPFNVQNLDTIEAFQAVVATAGTTKGVDELPSLPKYSGADSALTPDLLVVPLGSPENYPGRWFGYDAFEAVVIDTNDEAALSRLLNGGSALPLKDWVRRGGHLVLAVGANWQAVRDSALADILPASLAGQIRLNDLGALESFASSTNDPIKPPMMATKLEKWSDLGGFPLAATTATPLVVRRAAGLGRVTLVGLDVDQKPFADWAHRAQFWDHVLDIPGKSNSPNAPASTLGGGGAFYQSGINDLAGHLHKALERFEGVRLVPFGWVAFFVFLYILLIGPGDYFFLKKVVKRMELTWITFPLIVVTVSLLAYVAAYAIKGTDLRINKIDAIDLDQADGLVRGTTWLTIFSPQNRDYGVAITPLPLDQQPDAPAPSRPRAGTETVVSWFSPPNSRLAGPGGRVGLGGGGYDYGPEAESVDGVRVAIWSTKSFEGRWVARTSTTAVDADLTPARGDRVGGTITNRLGRPLRNAQLAFGKHIYKLGDIKPNQTIRVDPERNVESLSNALGAIADRLDRQVNVTYYSNEPEQPMRVAGPDLVRLLMFHDGLKARATEFPSVPLHRLDLSGQLELRRPMLVAELDGPAAALELTGASARPKLNQTTVLRVVLPTIR
jgi:hypothetical protein